MDKKTPIAIFMAASAILASNALDPNLVKAGEQKGFFGGLKEWTTDQEINEEGKLDEAAKAAKKKAEEEDLCIPIGEGENCW